MMSKKEHLGLLSQYENGRRIADAAMILSVWRGHFARRRTKVRRVALAEVVDARTRSANIVRLQAMHEQSSYTGIRSAEQECRAKHQKAWAQMLIKAGQEPTDLPLPSDGSNVNVPHVSAPDNENGENPPLESGVKTSQAHRWSKGANRFCWTIPMQGEVANGKVVVSSDQIRESKIGAHQVKMLRRATMEHLFSVSQLKRAMATIPQSSHADAVVSVWAKLTDLETLLREDPEFQALLPALLTRLGAANLFNPIRPAVSSFLYSRQCGGWSVTSHTLHRKTEWLIILGQIRARFGEEG